MSGQHYPKPTLFYVAGSLQLTWFERLNSGEEAS
jgi:hypothetical protein